MRILFHPGEKSIDVPPNITLLEAAAAAGVLIDGSCNGSGTCGKCKVRVVQGKTEGLDTAEKKILTVEEVEVGFRLACKTLVKTDMVVDVPLIHGGTGRKKDLTQLPVGFKSDIRLLKRHVKVRKATMKYQKNDLKRLEESLDVEKLTIDSRLLPQLHPMLQEKKGEVTAVLRNDLLIALEAGNTEEHHYGLAFDIGTTTVVALLWNLNTGELLDVEARTNPQSNFGADVITRIQFTKEGEGNLLFMQKKIIQCFNEMIQAFSIKNEITAETIYDVTVVGNTTMSHLFQGVDPESLARTPFAPVYCQGVNGLAKDYGLGINPLANVYVLPNIAGHVGSDIVAGMLATDIKKLKGITLAIDIGTNGEVSFIHDGKILVCSTAAGPAFEGASIHHGIRAAEGAIERVKIKDGKIILKIIDGDKPVGICGSGLIDAVAELLNVNIITKNGRIITTEEAIEAGIEKELCDRLIKSDLGMAFVLYQSNGRTILINQSDIREVQLAKAAMLAGMCTLVKHNGFSMDDVDRILIAGAFGNYIDKQSALRIGLLPDIGIDKIYSVGNAAGSGASMALLSMQSRKEAELLASSATHIELSMNPDFQDEYLMAMRF
ncbi:ASKHA domain-containing protein [Acetobacterium wieringae]|uniref:ASKHA domain-containing protein n=1 Tax=Acetobacterium wieringae TaxID=52694 RepID=UPI0026F02AA9|nr:ASKHA domain-containing protein [Acetobacterium wieringae]